MSLLVFSLRRCLVLGAFLGHRLPEDYSPALLVNKRFVERPTCELFILYAGSSITIISQDYQVIHPARV